MRTGTAADGVRLEKVKRPGGVFWLELDPVLHLPGGRVVIEDWDEYEESCRNRWMNSDDAELARTTALHCAEILRQGAEPWLWRGWQMLGESE